MLMYKLVHSAQKAIPRLALTHEKTGYKYLGFTVLSHRHLKLS